MDFDTAEVVPPRHASPAVFDKRANVFRSPDRHALAKFQGFRKTAILDACPPRRARDGNRAIWGEDGAKPDEAGCGEVRRSERLCVTALKLLNHKVVYCPFYRTSPASDKIFFDRRHLTGVGLARS
jgi:hypothetical protein